MKNEKVIQKWKNGKPGASDNGNLLTDGDELYSYDTLIGYTGPDGRKYVYNYTGRAMVKAGGGLAKGEYVSQTTSVHVGLASKVGNIVDPPQARITRNPNSPLYPEEPDSTYDAYTDLEDYEENPGDEEEAQSTYDAYTDLEDYEEEENPATLTQKGIFETIEKNEPICLWCLSQIEDMPMDQLRENLRELGHTEALEEDFDVCSVCRDEELCYQIEEDEED